MMLKNKQDKSSADASRSGNWAHPPLQSGLPVEWFASSQISLSPTRACIYLRATSSAQQVRAACPHSEAGRTSKHGHSHLPSRAHRYTRSVAAGLRRLGETGQGPLQLHARQALASVVLGFQLPMPCRTCSSLTLPSPLHSGCVGGFRLTTPGRPMSG